MGGNEIAFRVLRGALLKKRKLGINICRTLVI